MSGIRSNTSTGRATEAVLVENPTKTPKGPPERATQEVKKDPASSSPHQGSGESEVAPSQQDLRDPEPARNSGPETRPLARAKVLRALSKVEGEATTHK